MSVTPRDTPFVTASTYGVNRPFYVLVDQTLSANDPNCLSLGEGDIFLVTKYNKVGYWWGVSVYDLTVQGWFPSTFVQPYTGEVPNEASRLFSSITWEVSQKAPIKEGGLDSQSVEPNINIVTTDTAKFAEYESTMALVTQGRTTRVVDQQDKNQSGESSETELGFDYESWSKSKLENRNFTSADKRRKI